MNSKIFAPHSFKRLFSILALMIGVSVSSAHGDELVDLKSELEVLKRTIKMLENKVDTLEAKSKSVVLPQSSIADISSQVSDDVMKKIQPSVDAARQANANQFNPAMSLALDQVLSSSNNEGTTYEFRAAEIGLSANIDPFSKGYAFINGTDEGVEVEEAAFETTRLPYNLGLRGGRFFADFGRLSKWHDHDLPFVNRPMVLDTYVGGESQGDGIELSYLLPTEHYFNITLGSYNKVGGENERVENAKPRELSEFSYLGKVATSFSLGDTHTLDISQSAVITPTVKAADNAARSLFGSEITYRYAPLEESWLRGVTWSTEVLVNSEKREKEVSEDLPSNFKRENATGLYSYLEARLNNRFRPGVVYEYAQDLDEGSEVTTQAYSPYLSYWLSEFQRLRFQYTYLDAAGEGVRDDQQFYLQWTAFLGTHAHGFRDR